MILLEVDSAIFDSVLADLESLGGRFAFRRHFFKCALKVLVFSGQVTLVLVYSDSKLKRILFNHPVDLCLCWQISFEIPYLLVDIFGVLLELEDVFEHLSHQALVILTASDCRCDHCMDIVA